MFLAGLGVSLDSEKPHLVGIDEDVLSTGITLYHLNDGYVIFTKIKIIIRTNFENSKPKNPWNHEFQFLEFIFSILKLQFIVSENGIYPGKIMILTNKNEIYLQQIWKWQHVVIPFSKNVDVDQWKNCDYVTIHLL